MVLAIAESKKLARRAKLTYVADFQSGMTRKAQGKGFRYEYENGRHVSSKVQLKRIRNLAIPPAWTEVWICKSSKGHLQATGRDDAGRKQYIYHAQWNEKASQVKFDKLLEFGRLLSRLRPKLRKAMYQRSPLPERMLAVMVLILDETGIRIGNESYTQDNGSYGLTTLLGKHLQIKKGAAEFTFQGKSGQQQHVVIEDRKIVDFLKTIPKKDKEPLFSYDEDQQTHPLDAQQVNDFLHEATNSDFTAKDFRTWVGSARFAYQLSLEHSGEKKTDRRQFIKLAIEDTADFLGHTPAICKRYYIHPLLITAYEEGTFSLALHKFHKGHRKWLRDEDQLLLHLLRNQP
jgi:DNA topoisomerase IB